MTEPNTLKQAETLTIEQALQQAIAHHRANRLQDAERLYRAILNDQPSHPDANHNLGVLAVNVKNPAAGIPYFKVALEAKPNQSQFWLSYIDALLLTDQADLAKQVLEQGRKRGIQGKAVEMLVKRLEPKNPPVGSSDVKSNANQSKTQTIKPAKAEEATSQQRKNELPPKERGKLISLYQNARYADAITYAQALTKTYPHFGLGWKILGASFWQLGQYANALVALQKAVVLLPGDADIHNTCGASLRALGRLNEAELCYRRALEIEPDNALVHSSFGNTLKELGRLDEALAHYRKALDVSPTLFNAQIGVSNVLCRIVPQWHVPMMNEQKRNDAYHAALSAVITPDVEVLEIGAGSGLLAMMAAKLGANRVTTCEAVPIVAETAQRIVADNGYENAINVISKRSTAIEVGQDLPKKADILVTEIFSSELLGEHVLPSIEDAKRRLLNSTCRIIPAAGSVMIALFGGSDIGKNLVVEDYCGFNLQRFNSIVPKKLDIFRNDLNVEFLSDDIEAFHFDFEGKSFFPAQIKKLCIPITSPGRCFGVIQWIRLQMNKDVIYENHPSEKSAASSWQHCAYVFPDPIDVKPGQVVVVTASHNRASPWFTLERIENNRLNESAG